MKKLSVLICTVLALTAAGQADRPRPTPEQAAWQRMELTMFCHFGPNTFSDREWGDGKERESIFNPSDLDCRQWARSAKAAGFKLMILTAKHHDGFCLWPSKHTEHSVKNSPWKGGKGDVVQEFVEACRAEDLKIGLYLSPWDRNNPAYGSDAYNDYFCNQLTELLANYGTIDEVWFDGACGEGPNGKRQVYDWKRYYATIRKLQPKALIAIQGPDVRWVGNESGVAREGESSVQNAREIHGLPAGTKVWYPAECDVSIRPGWFYHAHEDGKVKSLDHLLDLYFKSVGRNSVLLVNVPPDRRGQFSDADVMRLREFGAAIRGLFANPVVTGSGAQELAVPAGRAFNLVDLRERIEDGERVQAYRVEARQAGAWRTIARGTVIGSCNLHRIGRVEAEAVRLVIEKQDGDAQVDWAVLDAPQTGAWGSGSLTAHKPAEASNVHPGGTQYGGDKAVDDDAATRWATSDETRACTLTIDLLREETFRNVRIAELDPRITQFRVEYRRTPDAAWQTAYEGKGAGRDFKAAFAPVKARYVRLNILDATKAPTIWEFALTP